MSNLGCAYWRRYEDDEIVWLHYDLAVCLTPSFERLPSMKEQGEPHVLIVDASHAARIAEQICGHVAVGTISIWGWRAGRASGEALAGAIGEKLSSGSVFDLIFLQLFDNTSFFARTFEGGLIPCTLELTAAPTMWMGTLCCSHWRPKKRSFDNCRPIFRACGNTKVVILSPLPRYITVGCCQDEEHAPNRTQENFWSTYISGLERIKKNIKLPAEKASLPNCTVYNTLWLIAGPKKRSEAEILNIIEQGWGNEPVHPNPSTYEKLASSIIVEELSIGRSAPKQEGVGLLSVIPE
jgi:hypothetical protein